LECGRHPDIVAGGGTVSLVLAVVVVTFRQIQVDGPRRCGSLRPYMGSVGPQRVGREIPLGPAPDLGAHTREILEGLLGYELFRVGALADAGLIDV
jgi:hypothetical protein